jgi:hypothetical protein
MFWKKSKTTDFERAKKAYYKYCYKNRVVPTKPLEHYSEIGGCHVFLKNQFGVIAKIFFVQKKQTAVIREPDHNVINLVPEFQ